MGRLLVPIALLAAVLVAVVAADRPAPRADFVFINRGDISTLDVQKASWMQDLRVIRLLFEGLVRNNVLDRDYTIQPAAAERWEISDDGLVYTFHLRDDACWNVRGEAVPLTAHDFVFSWRRAILPDTGSDYAGQFHLIRGAREFAEWRAAQLDQIEALPAGPARRDRAAALWALTERTFDQMVGLRALDDRTLRVELERPTAYFLDLCAFAVFYPVYPPLVRQYDRPDPASGRLDQQQGWTMAGVLVGNGPFTLESWRFKREVRLAKNPLYWNRDAINIDTISIPSSEDANAQVLAFTSGGVDWVSDVTPPYRRHIVDRKKQFYNEHREQYQALVARGLDPIEIDRQLPPDPRKNIHTFPAFGTYFYNFNCQPKLTDGRDNPFADPRVRRAFALAVDKRRIAEQIRGTGEQVAATLVPRNSIANYPPRGPAIRPARSPRPSPRPDTPAARASSPSNCSSTRTPATTSSPRHSPRTSRRTSASPSSSQRSQVFRQDLKSQNFMLSRAGWFGDYGDPTTFLDLNRCDDGNNDRSTARRATKRSWTAPRRKPIRSRACAFSPRPSASSSKKTCR